MYTYEHILMHMDLYSIHSSMHTIRHVDTNVLAKHIHTITVRYAHHAHSTHTYTHMRSYTNKRRFIYTYISRQTLTQRYVCTHKRTDTYSHILVSAQEELVTPITDTHMQRHLHAHTHLLAIYTVLQHTFQNK